MTGKPESASEMVCPHGAECDLCPWASISLAQRRKRKRAILTNALAAAAFDMSVVARVAQPTPCGEWGTDNTFTYATFGATKRFEAGLPKQSGDHPLQIEQCARFHTQGHELPLSLRQALRYLEHRGRHFISRATVRHSETTGETEVAIWTHPGHFPATAVGEAINHYTGATSVVRITYEGALAAPTSLGFEVLYGDGYWVEEVYGEELMVLANIPFPTNTIGTEKMVEFVVDTLRPKDGMHIAVLDAGIGLVALPLARRNAQVTAIEMDATAAACLQANLEHSEVDCEIVTDMNSVVTATTHKDVDPCAAWDVVVLDALCKPTDPKSVAMAVELHPQVIAYVASNAAEGVGVLAPLLDASYDIEAVAPFDLAPLTPRVAAVALFVRR